MSSNNGINSATNGRTGGGGSTSSSSTSNINLKSSKVTISQKNDSNIGTAHATQGVATAIGKSFTNNKTLPDKITTGTAKTATAATTTITLHNNDRTINSKINATHRRDNSSLSGGHHKDAHKFQYGKPQQPTSTIISNSSPKATGNEKASSSSSSSYNQENENRDNDEQNGDGNANDDDDDDDNQLVYYDGKLNSATLDALIKHMVPTHEYYPEHNYIFAFLLSARLFIRPHELLERISTTWEHQQQQQQQSQDVVDDASAVMQHHHHHYGGGHINIAVLNVNSASPLTQRKNSSANVTAIGAASTGNALELEPKPLQRTATQKSAQNCIRLLSEWIETFPYDFRDERLMQQVRILARKCVYIDNSLGKQVSRILQTLVGRLTALEQYEDFLQTLHAVTNVHDLNPNGSNSSSGNDRGSFGGYHNHGFQPLFGTTSASAATYTISNVSNSSADSGGKHSNSAGGSGSGGGLTNSNSSGSNSASTTPQPDDVFGIMDICSSCAHLAHQLTAIELERLSHIGPEEFVQAFAKEYQHSVTTSAGAAGNAAHVMSSSLNDMKKTRNLESYVEWFNRLSYLTATEIVRFPKKKQRVRIIEYWIETARECFNIGNFNSLMAIIAGLNLAPIARLKKTWSKVQLAKFSVLEHQMDPTSNFNSYRSTLKAAMWRSEGATDERERIIIPFFSLFVKDLYFLNEGCSNRLPNNHINFEKCSQLAKQVMEFNEWKKVSCPYEKLPNVIAYLQHTAVLNENTLSMASFECEPPENHEEKDRYKTVKAETKQQLLQQLQEQQLHHQQHHQQQ